MDSVTDLRAQQPEDKKETKKIKAAFALTALLCSCGVMQVNSWRALRELLNKNHFGIDHQRLGGQQFLAFVVYSNSTYGKIFSKSNGSLSVLNVSGRDTKILSDHENHAPSPPKQPSTPKRPAFGFFVATGHSGGFAALAATSGGAECFKILSLSDAVRSTTAVGRNSCKPGDSGERLADTVLDAASSLVLVESRLSGGEESSSCLRFLRCLASESFQLDVGVIVFNTRSTA